MGKAVILLAVGLCGFGGGVALAQYTHTLIVPAYGAGAAPAANDQTSEVQPEWAKRVESKLDKLLKMLEELDEKTPDPRTGAPDASDLFFRGDLSADQRDKLIRKVTRPGVGQMPPADKPQLTPEEKAALTSAFRGQKFDETQLSSAAGKCVSCHSPESAKEKGDGFMLFQRQAGDKKP